MLLNNYTLQLLRAQFNFEHSRACQRARGGVIREYIQPGICRFVSHALIVQPFFIFSLKSLLRLRSGTPSFHMTQQLNLTSVSSILPHLTSLLFSALPALLLFYSLIQPHRETIFLHSNFMTVILTLKCEITSFVY